MRLHSVFNAGILLFLACLVLSETQSKAQSSPPRSHGSWRQTITPAILLTTGGLRASLPVNVLDKEAMTALGSNSHGTFNADNITQHLPLAGFILLDACHVPSQHDLRQQLYLGAGAIALTEVSVQTIKWATHVTRPDLSNHRSFPSGHTAWAFAGAELVWQEFRQASPWYGIAAYSIAGLTGVLRVYNNRHWASDVLAGAGLGMLCVKSAYLIHQHISHRKSKSCHTEI